MSTLIVQLNTNGDSEYFNYVDLTLYVEKINGDKEWFECYRFDGVESLYRLHRMNELPARILANGDQEYWLHGEYIEKSQ
jgi:hypothetical protein